MTKQFKINPDLTCPELDGYKLPPLEDDVEKLADEYSNEFINGDYVYDGFKAGYTKARERYEFTESQLRQALSMAFMTIQDGGNITSDEIIASLRTTRRPIAIEVEMLPYSNPNGLVPATHPDGTVKVVKWIFNE